MKFDNQGRHTALSQCGTQRHVSDQMQMSGNFIQFAVTPHFDEAELLNFS